MEKKTINNAIALLFSVILLAVMTVFVIQTQTLSISDSFIGVAATRLKSMASDGFKKIGEAALSVA